MTQRTLVAITCGDERFHAIVPIRPHLAEAVVFTARCAAFPEGECAQGGGYYSLVTSITEEATPDVSESDLFCVKPFRLGDRVSLRNGGLVDTDESGEEAADRHSLAGDLGTVVSVRWYEAQGWTVGVQMDVARDAEGKVISTGDPCDTTGGHGYWTEGCDLHNLVLMAVR
jgi:hypothetical protein